MGRRGRRAGRRAVARQPGALRLPAALAAYRATVGSSAAAIAFAGPPVGLTTVAGAVAFEISASVMIVAALMAMFTVGRHTRADEEAGRTELVRAARVGRHAPLLAAVIVSALACVAMALAIGVVGTATGLPAAGSFLLGAAVGACGLVFTGVTAVAVQVSESTRSAYGLVGAVLGIAFVLRAIGDIEGNGLVWASPIGWAQAVHPYSDDRWWPLLLCVVATAVLLAVAVTLLDHRDLGAGLLQARPGAPGGRAHARLPAGAGRRGCSGRRCSPGRSAWRCSARSTAAWATRCETLFEDNPAGAGLLPGRLGAPAWWTPTWPPSSPSRRCSPRPTRSPRCSGPARRSRPVAPSRCSPRRPAGPRGWAAT